MILASWQAGIEESGASRAMQIVCFPAFHQGSGTNSELHLHSDSHSSVASAETAAASIYLLAKPPIVAEILVALHLGCWTTHRPWRLVEGPKPGWKVWMTSTTTRAA